MHVDLSTDGWAGKGTGGMWIGTDVRGLWVDAVECVYTWVVKEVL